jgi:hypothetical protein
MSMVWSHFVVLLNAGVQAKLVFLQMKNLFFQFFKTLLVNLILATQCKRAFQFSATQLDF